MEEGELSLERVGVASGSQDEEGGENHESRNATWSRNLFEGADEEEVDVTLESTPKPYLEEDREMFQLIDGSFLLKFLELDGYERALERGVLMITNKPFFVKPWRRDLLLHINGVKERELGLGAQNQRRRVGRRNKGTDEGVVERNQGGEVARGQKPNWNLARGVEDNAESPPPR
ncbi:hypothetical protein NE237_000602 [Protea cynaroides]|uniref:Uncharacterized protein n=1 Tax=Protea cynaroides TaxID=273540 RepID=A0A9Q0KSE2_9MAGN|nr:hypothetical protein NE237_000602 [Protea cynaroides]